MYYIRVDFNGTGEWTWLHYPADDECVAWNKKLKLSLNSAGTLELTYAKTHPAFGRIVARRTLIEVLIDKESLFIGEVREITHDTSYNESLYAVGALAWLENSIQGQEQFKRISVRQFLGRLLSDHNAQCPEHPFRLGIVDIPEPDPDDETLLRYTNYGTTWATIKDRLIDRFDDTAIRLRRDGSAYYIDFVTVQTYGNECEQDVRFGENLLDYSDSLTTDDICSSVVPLGATITDEQGNPSHLGNIIEKRVTIESVNGGRNYLENAELVSRFGHVRTTRSWSGVKTPAALKRKALAWINDGQWERLSLKIRIADLTLAGEATDAFRMGDRVYVVSEPYGLRKAFPIRSRTYDLDNPAQDEMRLGADIEGSFVSASVVSAAQTELASADSQYVMGDMLSNAIQNVTAMMTGSRGGYKYSDYDSQGRWLADYIMDSMDKATAKVVKKVTVDGTAYSRTGINGPYDTAIMANGTILGKYIAAHSINAEQISQAYTSMWESADTRTLNTARSEFRAGDREISAKVTQVEQKANGIRTDLAAEIKVRADQISSTVKKGEIGSAINQSAEKIYIESNKFGWDSSNSSLTTDGVLSAKNAVLENAKISGSVITGDPHGLHTTLNNNVLRSCGEDGRFLGKIGPVNYRWDSDWYFGVETSTFALSVDRILVGFEYEPWSGDPREVPMHEELYGYTGTISYTDSGGSPREMEFKNGFLIRRGAF